MAVNRYILNDQGEPVPEPNLMKWAKWYETADKHVAYDPIDEINVSTIFLGVDHAFGGAAEVGNRPKPCTPKRLNI
jgi:hypothetical protein